MANTVDLSLPDYPTLVARAGVDPDAEAARVRTAVPADVAGVASSFAAAGREFDTSWSQSMKAADTVGAAFLNDGAPVLDRATHISHLPAEFRDSGTWLVGMSRRVEAVSDELSATMRDTSAAVSTLQADLAAEQRRWAARISAATGPDGTIPMPALPALQAERERVAAAGVDLVRRAGQQVTSRIGRYEGVINRALQLAGERGFVLPLPGRDSDRSRDPDGRRGRRVDTDERTDGRGRTDPRDHPQADLSNDWAGRAILERYLTGGDDWHIENDPNWTAYLEANSGLRSDLGTRTDGAAQAAFRDYLLTGKSEGSYTMQYHQELQNGEGIVGYQYLHGTNEDVGDFQQRGATQVIPNPDGTYQVVMHNHYQWNDVIDANDQYSTDRWKSRLAEIVTLGKADPYQMSIGWDEETTITVDGQGNVIDRKGYPG